MSAEGERKAAPRAGSERAPAAGGNDAPADPEEQAASLPARAVNAEGQPRVLRTRLGLTPSPLEDYMVYTAAENDTWSLLAERFYRSATYVPLLRAANEDLERPRANEAILVPVYDFRAAPADHEPRRAAPARSPAQEPAPAGTTYEVVDGDNLWKIASKVYGSGVRWMDLYEANKDVMSDPDALTIGMNLRIPR
jgi:nucleoid-associated protein YgaU